MSSPLTSLQLSHRWLELLLLLSTIETPVDQARSRRVDVANVRVTDERHEDQTDLWSFVWVVLELCVGQERVEHPEICMP